MIVFGTSDFSATKTTGNGNLDTLSTHTHGSADRKLHSAAERNSSFELACNAFSNELSGKVGVSHLNNIHRSRLSYFLLNGCFEFFNFRALTADNHTGLCTVNEHSYSVVVAFDFDLRNAGREQALLEIASQIVIGNKSIAEGFILLEPSRIPVFNNTDTKTVRINFLTHSVKPPSLSLFL